MSTLPPGAPGAPNSSGPGGESEIPRWAAPAVPPPWAGTGQTAPAPSQAAPTQAPAAAPTPAAQPGWATPGYAASAPARSPSFDRRKWLPTAAVAAVIAGVVLGGIGLDKVVAAPSVGTVSLGGHATMTAAPGWSIVEQTDTSGVTLQKANVRVLAIAQEYSGTAREMLAAEQDGLRREADQINFGTEHDTTVAGHETAMIGFTAIVSGSSGGTIEGELICMIVSGDGAEIIAIAPLGMLDSAADDIKAMVSSIEVTR